LAALRFVQTRRPTKCRFGAEADATWADFRGDLGGAARIDLLLRDADAQWPGAFGARSVYDLAAVAADEAFGATWEPSTMSTQRSCGVGWSQAPRPAPCATRWFGSPSMGNRARRVRHRFGCGG